MREPEFRMPGSNITFVGAIPSLTDCLVRVGRMAEAFQNGASDDLRDIRTADVISLVSDLYGRASEFERAARRPSSERGGE